MNKNYFSLTVLSVLVMSLAQGFASEVQTYSAAEEAEQLKNEINAFSEEVNQKILQDENYSPKLKDKATAIVNEVKIKDEDIQEILNNEDVTDKKKAQVIRKLRSLKNKLEGKVHSQPKQEETVTK